MPHLESASLDGLQQIVDRLATRLGRSVAIDDAQGRLVASSEHFGEEDSMRVWAIVHRYSDPRVLAHFRAHDIYSWTEPGRIPENLALQMKARVCCPIRNHDILFGHLFLIDEGVADDEIAAATAATAQIGELMYRRLTQHEESQRRAETIARQLVSPDLRAQRRAADQALEDRLLVATEPVSAVVVRVLESSAGPETIQTDLYAAADLATRDRFRGVSLMWLRTREAVVLLFGRAAGDARTVADHLTARLLMSDHRAVAGVGPACAGESAAATSFADASLASQAAGRIGELGTVVTADSLGVYRMLLKLPPDEFTPARYPVQLQRLIAGDSADSLIETLETYLDCGGDVGRTAAALHVHRSTLYYRIGRIEAIAGVDLREGGDRLILAMGLKLRRLVESP